MRIDTGYYTGCSISAHYDSLLAKVIVTGRDRKEALQQLQHALEEFYIEGVQTTRDWCISVLAKENYVTKKLKV